MFFLYNCIVFLAGKVIQGIAFFSPKLHLFVEGRKNVFSILQQKIQPHDKTIWFHAASLGEFEQGLPVIEELKKKFPQKKIIVSFFSPSGYEVRKNNTIADATVYLPLDTIKNVKTFLDIVHPEMVFFIKYEFWPNYLNELKKRQIKTYLISGIFRKNQVFFKWYGSFYRKALHAFDYFFVQNESSKNLLHNLQFTNVKVSGDTRFDRVTAILERENRLDFIEEFLQDNALNNTIVIGSSWPKDEKLLIPFINKAPQHLKFIIAPHNIKPDLIASLRNQITQKTVLYSEKDNTNLASYNVLIIDTIGLLTKIYSYADIAYVGGGFGSPGVHNILEPATFGVPIIIGPNYSHFAEATALVHAKGCTSVTNEEELNDAFWTLLHNEDIRLEQGHICATFVQMNKGATARITAHILNETLK